MEGFENYSNKQFLTASKHYSIEQNRRNKLIWKTGVGNPNLELVHSLESNRMRINPTRPENTASLFCSWETSQLKLSLTVLLELF